MGVLGLSGARPIPTQQHNPHDNLNLKLESTETHETSRHQ